MIRGAGWEMEAKWICVCLRTGLLLLLAEESVEGNIRDLDDLETDTGKITDGVTTTAETGDEDFVVLIDKVKATITRDEGSDLLSVLDELDTDALTNGRVGLLGLNTDLLDNNALGVRGSLEGLHPLGGKVSKVVCLVVPALETTDGAELTGCTDTTGTCHLEKKNTKNK